MTSIAKIAENYVGASELMFAVQSKLAAEKKIFRRDDATWPQQQPYVSQRIR